MATTDYTTYSLEGACALFITVLAYRLYKMRCNTSSKCCGDSIEADFHNDGVGGEVKQIENVDL
jgi:hypothetical protein